jgi:hypothetical protein
MVDRGRVVKVSACAVSLNVDDVPASTAFLVDHFGFHTEMAADGSASLTGGDIGMNIIFLRRGLPTLPLDQRDDHARGLILALTIRVRGRPDRRGAIGWERAPFPRGRSA